MRTAAVAISALLAVTACGGDAEPDESASLADEVGCEALEPAETAELFVQERFTCEPEGTAVYTFASSDARDSWREIAEEFGTVVVNEGDTWLEVD